jgi:hypothetical protein
MHNFRMNLKSFSAYAVLVSFFLAAFSLLLIAVMSVGVAIASYSSLIQNAAAASIAALVGSLFLCLFTALLK